MIFRLSLFVPQVFSSSSVEKTEGSISKGKSAVEKEMGLGLEIFC